MSKRSSNGQSADPGGGVLWKGEKRSEGARVSAKVLATREQTEGGESCDQEGVGDIWKRRSSYIQESRTRAKGKKRKKHERKEANGTRKR